MSAPIRLINVCISVFVLLAINPQVNAEVAADSMAVTLTRIDSTAAPATLSSDVSQPGIGPFQMFQRAEKLYVETIELLRDQMKIGLWLAGFLLTILTILVAIFGIVRPERTRAEMREEIAGAREKIAQLKAEMRDAVISMGLNSEHFTLALGNVIQGNLDFESSKGPSAFKYYSTGLDFLIQVKAWYQRLETIYSMALQGVLNSSATPWGKNDPAYASIVLRALTFLENEQYWQQNNDVMSLVSRIRALSEQG